MNSKDNPRPTRQTAGGDTSKQFSISTQVDVLILIALSGGRETPIALACTSKSLRATLACESVWRMLATSRWSLAEAATPTEAHRRLLRSSGSIPITVSDHDAPPRPPPDASWRALYCTWTRTIDAAVSQALAYFRNELAPPPAPASGSFFLQPPSDLLVDYEEKWAPALRRLAAGAVGMRDVCTYLVTETQPVLINFLGLAYAMIHLIGDQPMDALRAAVLNAVSDRG